jgi:hypothetical protein
MGGSSSSRDCKPGKAQLKDFWRSSKLAAREAATGSCVHDDLNVDINERVWCRANEAMMM